MTVSKTWVKTTLTNTIRGLFEPVQGRCQTAYRKHKKKWFKAPENFGNLQYFPTT